MHKVLSLLWIIAVFGFSSDVNAQTPTPFDGTYAFVSSTKLNDTYFRTGTNGMGRCADLPKVSRLIIANGIARYNTLRGTVNSFGELTMRAVLSPTIRGSSPGVEIMTSGRIDGNGTVHARRMTYYCRYDLVWQKNG